MRPGIGLADGIVVTPSHNPPSDGGFKYNPPHGGPADSDATKVIAAAANAYIRDGLKKAGFQGGWLDAKTEQAAQAAPAAPPAPADLDAAAARALGTAESRANQAAQPEAARPQQPE